jgi:hypothetical protein
MKKLDDEGRDVPRSLTKAAKPCLNNAWFSCMSTDKKRVVNPFSLPAARARKFAIAVSKTCHPEHKKFVHAKAKVTPAFCRFAAQPSLSDWQKQCHSDWQKQRRITVEMHHYRPPD